MRDIKELCSIVEDELGKIAEKGLTSGNLDTAYKLIDIYKDIKSTEYWDRKGEYYEEMLSQMREEGYSGSMESGNGGSYNRGSYNSGRSRYSGGHYSRENESGNSFDGGSSGRRNHYVRGHYSRSGGNSGPYNDYVSEKQSYRTSGKSEECKQRMLAALEEHMDALTQEIGDLSKDADCREERDVLSHYIDKLKKMM